MRKKKKYGSSTHTCQQARRTEGARYHLDHIDSARTAPTRLRSRESDGNVRRVQLLAHIEHKFKEYGQSSPIVLYVQTLIDSMADLLTIAKTLSGFNKPPERDWLSIKTYFDFEERVCNTESHTSQRRYHKLKAG
jgi:hypothetical protein